MAANNVVVEVRNRFTSIITKPAEDIGFCSVICFHVFCQFLLGDESFFTGITRVMMLFTNMLLQAILTVEVTVTNLTSYYLLVLFTVRIS